MNDYPHQNNQPPQEPQQQFPQQPFTQYQPDSGPPPLYQPPMPPAPPKKKRGPLFWAVLTIGIIVALIICGNAWNAAVSSQASNTTATQPQATQVPPTDTPDVVATTTAVALATQYAATYATSTASYTPAPTQAPATWKTTHTFTGNGIKKTATFSVADDWKILYTCTHQDMGIEGVLGVMVYTSDNTIVDVAVNATCKPNVDLTKGETEEHQGGDIYLSIDGTGDWTVQVQELQ